MAADSAISVEEMPMKPLMRLLIEIAATFLVVCITASSAAFAAGKMGRSADGLSCAVTLPQNASPATRCAAIKRQCGGKFYASACGDKLMSAMN
jgi:Tfp pilus assembly protein FimV